MGEVGPLWCGGKGLFDVGQLGLPQVPVEGWVIDLNEHGLLDGPTNIVHFPAHNRKAVHIDGMPCRLAVIVNGGGGSKVYPKPVPKLFFLTACPVAFEPVYYSTLLGGSVLDLGAAKRVWMVL